MNRRPERFLACNTPTRPHIADILSNCSLSSSEAFSLFLFGLRRSDMKRKASMRARIQCRLMAGEKGLMSVFPKNLSAAIATIDACRSGHVPLLPLREPFGKHKQTRAGPLDAEEIHQETKPVQSAVRPLSEMVSKVITPPIVCSPRRRTQ